MHETVGRRLLLGLALAVPLLRGGGGVHLWQRRGVVMIVRLVRVIFVWHV
jgi:hypothetical protein